LPRIQALYDEYHAQGYEPLAINLFQDMNSVVKPYARLYDYQFLRDAGTVWNQYKINSYIPLNYVIDTAQIVVGRMEGFTESTIRSWIEPNLMGIHEHQMPQPLQFALAGSSPATGRSAVRFSLPQAGNVSLRVYSSSGSLVKTVFDGTLAAGSNTLNWNLADNGGRPVANGLYVYELVSGSTVALTKVSVLR
jgi:hypothetical protein